MLASCDLDTAPTTDIEESAVFSSTDNAEKVLVGAWNYLMTTWYTYANPGYGAMLRANDAMGSDVVLNTKYGFRNHYAFSAIYGKGYTNTLSWLLSYRVINDCNNVIANIESTNGSESERNRIKGQALALRGFMYLHLASSYSFAINKDPDAVCAPIYTTPTDLDVAQNGNPASSVSEVYAQSISDLETALSLIPESYTREVKYKIDHKVVLGMLSRACLYAREWTKAKTYSDQFLSLDDYLMTETEYKSGFNDASNGEWILAHPQTADENDPSYQFHFLDTTTSGSYYYSFNVDPYFRDLFDDSDYRKNMIFWAPNPGSTVKEGDTAWMRYSKFKFRTMDNDGVADIVLMRNAEMYLINSEAKAQLGESDAATRLNELKTARGAKTIDSSLSGQALLDEIWLERRKELWGEGFALIDIIRNQQSVVRKEYPDDTMVDYTYTDSEGNTQTVKMVPQGHRIVKFPDGSSFCANSKYYLYRITDAEETSNKNLYKNHSKLSIYTE